MTRHSISTTVAAILSVALFLTTQIASAISLATNTLTFGTDSGKNYGWTIDGVFDSFQTTTRPIFGSWTNLSSNNGGYGNSGCEPNATTGRRIRCMDERIPR